MKIALGSVQFGIPYGVSNNAGEVSAEELELILNTGLQRGITTLDTAINYGETEKRLGNAGVTAWHIITKLPALDDEQKNIEKWTIDHVEQSLKRLKVKKLKGVLLHNANDLLLKKGDQVYQALSRLKDDGVIEKIGISIYSPDILNEIFPMYDLEIVQAPFNVFDRRLQGSGWLDRLSSSNVEVHVRSVFLQGLLLMNKFDRPNYFSRWNTVWKKWDAWLIENNISRLHACLGFVLSEVGISKIIVGVQSVIQLNEIVLSASKKQVMVPEYFNNNDIGLINPGCWNE